MFGLVSGLRVGLFAWCMFCGLVGFVLMFAFGWVWCVWFVCWLGTGFADCFVGLYIHEFSCFCLVVGLLSVLIVVFIVVLFLVYNVLMRFVGVYCWFGLC